MRGVPTREGKPVLHPPIPKKHQILMYLAQYPGMGVSSTRSLCSSFAGLLYAGWFGHDRIVCLEGWRSDGGAGLVFVHGRQADLETAHYQRKVKSRWNIQQV